MSMKVLRRDDEFRKVPENNMEDVKVINNLIKQGWNYCSKSVYKEFHGIEKKVKEIKDESGEPTKKVTREKRMAKKKRGK